MATPVVTWQVQQMTCYPQADGYTDVVFKVDWVCIAAVSAEPNAQSAYVTSSTYLTQPSGSFTPYDQLTQEQVLGWVWGVPDFPKFETESSAVNQLDQLVNPPVVTPPLPWATQAAAPAA